MSNANINAMAVLQAARSNSMIGSGRRRGGSIIANRNIYSPGLIMDNYRKSTLGRGRRRGAGFFGNLWNGVKKAANWVKDKKIISRVLNVIPDGRAKAAGAAAGALGLGRRRRRAPARRPAVGLGRRRAPARRPARRQGGSLRSFLSKAHNFVKSNQLVSRGLSHLKYNKLANAAKALGYGKRKRAGRPRKTRR